MIGILTAIVIAPVYISLNSQEFLDSFLKEVGTVTEKVIGTVEKTQTESFEIYSDDNYQTKTTNFSQNQKIFVMVKTSIDGITKKSINLLDQNKNRINSYEMNKTDSAPFMYTKSLDAPKSDGLYYLDVEVRNGENLVYKAEQNINVGRIGSNSDAVKVETKAEANTGGKIETNINTTIPMTTPQMTPNIAGDSGKNVVSFTEKMNQVFMYVNTILTNLQKLLSTVNSK